MEIWKDIPGYEGAYMASTDGRIKSLPRNTTKGGILTPHVSKHNGYCSVVLSKNGVRKTHRLHVLIYKTFIGPVPGKYDTQRTIDHIDCDKTNNAVTNLEMCTLAENHRRAFRNGLHPPVGIKVIDLDTLEVFQTEDMAAKSVGGNRGGMVRRVCIGARSHYREHRFAFYDDYVSGTIPTYKGKHKRKASKTLWR